MLNKEVSYMHQDQEAMDIWQASRGQEVAKVAEKPQQEPFFKIRLLFEPGPPNNLHIPFHAI